MNKLPVQPKKRIELLDVFRGFAVFGIFVVNIEIMNCVFMNQDVFSKQWTDPIDTLTTRIFQLFFYSKFFPIFSFLFGLGISMQALSMSQKNELTFSFFARRMLILFFFGVLHILLLWSGDVIHLYAILGLFVTLLIKKSNRLIIGLSVLFLIFPFYDQIAAYAFQLMKYQPESYLSGYMPETIVETIRNGSYVDGIRLRANEYMANIPMLFTFLAPVALSMFLLGLYFGKNSLITKMNVLVDLLKKPVIIIAIITNLYRIIFLFFLPGFEIYKSPVARPVFLKLMFLSDVVMGLFYLWLLAWLWYHTNARKIISPLKYVGRMALTNYIMHSFIGLLLFSSIGFSLYETMSPSETLFTALVVFCVQILYSKLWLRYFKFGPLEWVWRCFTYKKLLPMKK
ncbi:DUF418 domain-containing protein [Aquimarina gracilis]|uniref:DUF418 domain-containing protein n=1 Tax=Aquimarina gracilis TaxID=874422 RepID=A0ABU5ZWP1_9FLAO|nr:DUF418 domain-containing protein [Aquimarina gracilis]MEB3346299.1 DUF418 domain-containing protein [Aquimarina gracilis]